MHHRDGARRDPPAEHLALNRRVIGPEQASVASLVGGHQERGAFRQPVAASGQPQQLRQIGADRRVGRELLRLHRNGRGFGRVFSARRLGEGDVRRERQQDGHRGPDVQTHSSLLCRVSWRTGSDPGRGRPGGVLRSTWNRAHYRRRLGTESSGTGWEMAGSSNRIRFGAFTLDLHARQLCGASGDVPLSPKAFALLAYLVEQRPRVVPKEELLDRVWAGVFVEEQNVKNLVSEIRAALADPAAGPRFIRTVFGVGYAFCGEASEDGGTAGGPVVSAYLVAHTTVHRVYAGDNLLGRDSDCAIVIDASGVSRHHARITASAAGVTVEDLGSKNGTWVNGARLDSRAMLADGDELRVGIVTMTVRLAAQRDTSTIVGPVG